MLELEDFKLSLGRRARLTQLEAMKQGISGRKNVKSFRPRNELDIFQR